MNLEERTSEILDIYKEFFGEPEHYTKPEPQGLEKVAEDEPLSSDAAERLQELFEADPIFKGDLFEPAPVGKRSDAEFHLCARLWEAGFSENEIYRIMCSSPQTKWGERDDNYRQETIRKAIAKAEANHKKGDHSLEEIETSFKADPDSITTSGSLATLSRLSPFKLAGFFKKIGITGDQKKILLNLLNPNEESTPKEIDPVIRGEAERILGKGKAFEYVLRVWQKRHHGDENLGKALLLSIGAQSCVSSKGVHVHACGPRGLGKSDGTEKASEAIPPSHLLVGSASPKALYYLGERLPAGSVVYLDDIGWNDQAAQMFKTCTTFYKEGATHTVVVDQEIQQFKTAPRIIFWITTADAQTDEQVRDRLLRIDITEDPKHTQEIIDFIFEQRKSGAATFDSHEIEVCRTIIYLLKQVFVDVVIPFADYIKFEGDPRGATIFADLVSSFAIWRHHTRNRDKNGIVIASYEDYKDAETFFNAIKGHSDTKYTPGELRTLQAIKDLYDDATREKIMEKTGFSKGALSDVLNGRSRDGQAKYGLLHKCPALTEEDEGTLEWAPDKNTKTSRKKKVYRLPKDYDILKSYGKAVYLGTDETTVKRLCSESSPKFADGSQEKNEFGKELVRKFVEYNNIRGRRTNEQSLSSVDLNVQIKPFSFLEPKIGELANLEPIDNYSSLRTFSEPSANYPIEKAEDSDSRAANQPKGPIVCAVCGADLTGHGTIEKNGLFYCAQPGCGYPKRGEGAEA